MDYSTPGLPFQGGGQTNPWFTVANQFVPRNLHDVIRWARYITIQSPTTSEVIRKLATYPITDFLIDTEQAGTRERYESILTSFKLKEILQDVGFEFFTLGNVFISIYFPIHRELECPTCKTKYNVKKASWAVFKQYQFSGVCPNCNYKGIFKRTDSKSLAVEDMNFIKWTPEHIAVSHNPITGESEYYYRIPNSVKQKIQKGDRLFVDSLPWAFIDAVRYNQDFKFDKDAIFHLKNISSGGSVEGISVPPLLSLFSLVFYQATLRKANEAIATEYLNPLRVVYPAAQTANADPVISMSLRNFKGNMENALQAHKRDKNHILVAPTPVGYSTIGGEGKNLLVAQEIQQAEDTILLSLGVSRELLSGTTNWTSTSVGLRMMENLLASYIGRIHDLITWSMKKTSAYLSMELVKVSLIPFKLLDDDNFKMLLSELAKTGRASDRTLFEELGLDFHDEQERIKEEQVIRATKQVEAQFEVEQAQFVAAKAAGKNMAENEEYKVLLGQAQQLAEQIFPADDNSRRVALGQLKLENYSLYLMTKQILDGATSSAAQAANPTPNGADGAEQGFSGTPMGGPMVAQPPEPEEGEGDPADNKKSGGPKGQSGPKKPEAKKEVK